MSSPGFLLPPPPPLSFSPMQSTSLQVIHRLSEPGFLCRKHTITTTTSQQPLHKIQQAFSLPVLEGHANLDSSYVWTWCKANRERNYSILNAERGVFIAGEKICEGGRVYCMTATGEVEKRLWTGTAVSGCGQCVVCGCGQCVGVVGVWSVGVVSVWFVGVVIGWWVGVVSVWGVGVISGWYVGVVSGWYVGVVNG